MLSAHELVTRWPALGVAEKLARVNHSLHLDAGPLDGALRGASDAAMHAANGLFKSLDAAGRRHCTRICGRRIARCSARCRTRA